MKIIKDIASTTNWNGNLLEVKITKYILFGRVIYTRQSITETPK